MQLAINHLTRMQPGLICTAGVDLSSGRHIRPVVGGGLSSQLLARNGGPLDLGRIIELGPSEFCGAVPEIEDRRFSLDELKVVGELSEQELFRICEEAAEESLKAIFSEDLEWVRHAPDRPGTAAVPEHRGVRSLGCYWADRAELIVTDSHDRRHVRITFQENELQFSVPVTDVRLYLSDQVTPDEAKIESFAERIAEAPRTLVAVGLSRAYRACDDQPARHWLQVNNVFVA